MRNKASKNHRSSVLERKVGDGRTREALFIGIVPKSESLLPQDVLLLLCSDRRGQLSGGSHEVFQPQRQATGVGG